MLSKPDNKQHRGGTKFVGNACNGRVIYESICNMTGCYDDAVNYGFCDKHVKGQAKDKDGVWIHHGY